jgi:hypothetical protein
MASGSRRYRTTGLAVAHSVCSCRASVDLPAPAGDQHLFPDQGGTAELMLRVIAASRSVPAYLTVLGALSLSPFTFALAAPRRGHAGCSARNGRTDRSPSRGLHHHHGHRNRQPRFGGGHQQLRQRSSGSQGTGTDDVVLEALSFPKTQVRTCVMSGEGTDETVPAPFTPRRSLVRSQHRPRRKCAGQALGVSSWPFPAEPVSGVKVSKPATASRHNGASSSPSGHTT